MQTFLVPPGDLDTPRLRKQIVECKQIIIALTEGKGWVHHPATKMWAGHVPALADYALGMIWEYNCVRDFESTLTSWFDEQLHASGSHMYPWWWGNTRLVETHHSNLIRKLPGHYRDLYPEARDGLPYLWPAADSYTLRLSAAEAKRDPLIPADWTYNPLTREVTF